MKKFSIFIFTIILLSTGAVAEVVTTRRAVPKAPPVQVSVPPISTGNLLADNIKSCSPYSESLRSSALGIKFDFYIRILGWYNNKCRIDFTAKSYGVTSLFKSLYGVSPRDAQIYTYEPVAKCAFTKSQLATVGDSVLQEKARAKGEKMLKNPEEISLDGLRNMSPSDKALMDIIFSDGACSITNGSSNPIEDADIDSFFGY